MKVYLAGPLFSEADQAQRLKEGELLAQKFPTLDIYNPIAAPFNEDKSSLPTAQSIFEGDYQELTAADIVIADISEEDPGTIMELGFAIEQGSKIIIGINSDMRLPSAHEYAYPTKGVNHFVLGALEKHGYFVTSFAAAMQMLEQVLSERQ